MIVKDGYTTFALRLAPAEGTVIRRQTAAHVSPDGKGTLKIIRMF